MVEAGERWEIVAQVCPAFPGVDACAKHVVREVVVSSANQTSVRKFSLERIELQDAGAWTALPICHLYSPYILFPVEVTERGGQVQAVAFPEAADAECGESMLRDPAVERVRAGCSSVAECSEAGFDAAYRPYITGLAATDADNRRIAITRTQVQRN
jgi:hypothetical protein